MVRTQVSLSEEQHRFLTDLAHQTGVSLSELVRRAVDLLHQRERTPAESAIELLGAFEADRSNIAVHHDDYFLAATDSRKSRAR